MLTVILAALAPVFALIGLGFVCGRMALLGEHAFEVLNRFVITLALPALTFRTLARMNPADLAQPSMIAAVLGGALGIYGLAFLIERVLGRSGSEANIVALASGFSNTAFVGLPIVTILFGTRALGPSAIVIALNASVVFGIGVLISELAAHRPGGTGASVRIAIRAVARNPLIVSAVLGVIWAAAGVSLGGPLDVTLQALAAATAPCALMAIGLFIARPRPSSDTGTMARVALLKLVAQPLLTLGLIALMAPMPSIWAKTAIVLAGMPAGTSSFLLAGGAGTWAMQTSARAIVVTTIAAAPTLVAVLWLVGV